MPPSKKVKTDSAKDAKTEPKTEGSSQEARGAQQGQVLDLDASHGQEFVDEEEGTSLPVSGSSPPKKPDGATFEGGFNSMKNFNGQYYSGMQVGMSHDWKYDEGRWQETKVEPDLWEVDFETHKHRSHNAPKNSGAPVGTSYHWLVVAHQYVTKEDANTYSTHLKGSKYKVRHRQATSDSWNITKEKAVREREVECLEDAKRRIEGLPPVHASQKARDPLEKKIAGQKTLESMFGRGSSPSKASAGTSSPKKRKATEGE